MIIIRQFFSAPLFLSLFFLSFTYANDTIPDSACISFEYPAKGTIIKNSSCTLSINACHDIRSISLSAFCQTSKAIDTFVIIDTIKQSPYKFIWNIPTDFPDQLYKGIRFVAHGRLKNGDTTDVSLGDVFLFNKVVPSRSIKFPASIIRTKLLRHSTISLIKAQTAVNVSGYWDVKKLHISISLTDNIFKTLTQDKLLKTEVIAFLDPLLTKDPFPSEKTKSVAINLNGKSYKRIFSKTIDTNGIVNFKIDTTPYTFSPTIKKSSDNQYQIGIDIPVSEIYSIMPDSMGFNLIFKMSDQQGNLNYFALNDAKYSSAYCPILWLVIHRTPATLLDNVFIIVAASFCIGLLLALLSGFLLLSKGKHASFNISDLSEDYKQKLQAMNDFIEQNITNKNLTVHEMAREVSISVSKCESLLKKCTGLSFKDFIMKSRVEIAKERLRCSHSGEKTIAESCGFKNIDEMKKCFLKYCKSTPHKYRRDNQVA